MQHFWSEDIRKAGTCSFSRLLTACRLQLNFDHTVENTDIWSMQDLLSPGDSPVFHEVTVVTSSQLLAIKALCNFWLSKALKKPAETCRGNIDVGMNAVSGTTCVKSMEKKKKKTREQGLKEWPVLIMRYPVRGSLLRTARMRTGLFISRPEGLLCSL